MLTTLFQLNLAGAGGTTFTGTVSESAAGTDTPTAALIAQGSLAETSGSGDAQSSVATFVGTRSETAAATESETGTWVTSDLLSETGETSDGNSSTWTTAGAVAETQAAGDGQTGGLSVTGSVAETATPAEAASATTPATPTVHDCFVADSIASADACDGDVTLYQAPAPKPIPFMYGGGGGFEFSPNPFDEQAAKKPAAPKVYHNEDEELLAVITAFLHTQS